MPATAAARRFLAFFLPDAGGTQVYEVDGSRVVMDVSGGGCLGTFPRQEGEDYSWYLCSCEPDPVAWRAKVPADLQCRHCNIMPGTLFACPCGVVSPADIEPACAWCRRGPSGPSHACRGVGGDTKVLLGGASCPFCGETPAPTTPPISLAPLAPATPADPPVAALPAAAPPSLRTAQGPEAGEARATPRVAPFSPPVAATLARAGAPSRRAQATAPAAAAPAPPQAQPAPVAAAPSGAAPAPRRRSGRTLFVLAVAAAVLIYLLVRWVGGQGPYGRALEAIGHGDLLSSSGSSAVELYNQLAQAEPGSTELRDLGRRISAVLRPQADALLQRFYSESDENTDWPRLAAMYGFLAKTDPADRELTARLDYCNAQLAFARGSYREALDGYQQALALHADWPLALNGIGKVYVRGGAELRSTERAKEFYQRAHAADPRFIFPLLNLAKLVGDEQPQEALGYLRQAIAIEPGRASLYRELGRVYVRLHRNQDAIQAYQQCLRYETDPAVRGKIEEYVRELGTRGSAHGLRRPR